MVQGKRVFVCNNADLPCKFFVEKTEFFIRDGEEERCPECRKADIHFVRFESGKRQVSKARKTIWLVTGFILLVAGIVCGIKACDKGGDGVSPGPGPGDTTSTIQDSATEPSIPLDTPTYPRQIDSGKKKKQKPPVSDEEPPVLYPLRPNESDNILDTYRKQKFSKQ